MKHLFKQRLGAVVSAVSAATVLASTSAHAAGTVQVKFVDSDKFSDVRGNFHRVDEGLLRVLEEHFKSAAAQHVPEGRTLTIEVLDVDLAGEFRPRFSASPDVRVLGLGADSPHIKLRYTLSSPSGAADLAEVSLRDMGYLLHGAGRYPSSEPLPYEKRMIDQWAKTTFAAK